MYSKSACGAALAAALWAVWASGGERNIEDALEAAVEVLESGSELAGLKGPGPAALTAMALLAAGSDPTGSPLREAIDYVERQAFTSPENTYVGTYTAATSLSLLHMAGRDAGTGGSAVEALARRLISYQEANGGWGDMSRSQFAALGLYGARAMGFEVPKGVFQRLRSYVLGMQNTDGGWPYRDKGTASTGSMTSGALAALHVVERALASGTPQCTTGSDNSDTRKAIDKGLKWLRENQSYTRNPGDDKYYYYYLYSLERAMKYLGLKQLGEVDWYSQAADRVIRLQSEGGTWAAPPLDYANQFAVLFLSRSGWPAAISKLEHGNDWNLDPYDAEIWTEELCRKLHMPAERRVISLNEPLDYLLRSPLIYVTGRGPLKLPGEKAVKLAQYVEKGGTLLFAPSHDGKAFTESVKDLLAAIFPDNALTPLESDDALYLAPNLVEPNRVPAYGIKLSCRTGVILTEATIPCALSGCSNSTASGYSGEDARRFAVNVGYYALGVGGYFKEKEKDGSVPPTGTGEPEPGTVEFRVGWLRYGGDWHPFPESLGNLLNFVNRETGRVWWWEEVRARGNDLHGYPLLFMTGTKPPRLTDAEKQALRAYIERGGRIIAEPACGSRPFIGGLREMFQEALPECEIKRLMPGESVYTCLYEISRVEYKEVVKKEQPKLTAPWLEGVYWRNRMVALYSPYNLSAEWAETGYVHSRGLKRRDAYMLGANMLAYFFVER
ncbi:MAG: DUF4159 domain-containing protein [Planctomycetes bacterium]|nr:DUF4159 domain-containing protein [Planctomycetota bacterium]